ncbi:MAG: Maf family nucleotide pyrophosphatase [Saprospiraceae bacterium]|nr:Maf family nucleotide pyrophosphatase [Saprospiraceae bacterium]
MNLENYKILLASQSPRRSQLLRESGFTNFTVRPTDSDETLPPQYPVEKAAAFLADMKAEAARSWLTDDEEIILAADTTVVLNNTIYNKPVDFADAQHILRQLSGKVHKVITGVCLLSRNKKRVFSETAKVHFDVLTEADIDFYITHYKPFDKAGAYAVQDWIGHCKIKRIEGSYENIMGLPTHKVYTELTKHF